MGEVRTKPHKGKEGQNSPWKIAQLRLYGKGTELPGVKESLWGTFNAVLEYVDHYERDEGTGISWSLLGSGAVVKRKAYGLAVGFLQHENLDWEVSDIQNQEFHGTSLYWLIK